MQLDSDLETTVALADAVGQALLIVDESGAVIRTSGPLHQLAVGPLCDGRPVGRADAGHGWGEVVDRHGAPLPEERWPIRRTLAEGERVDGDVIGFRTARGTTWVTMSSLPVPDRSTAPRRRALVLLRIVAEEGGRGATSNSSGAPLEAQLAQAQRFETIGRLAGGVAHDFNNLLGVIANYAGFLAKRADLPDELRGDVEQISEAARRGSELTRQLLLVSRHEQPSPRRVDLCRVLEELRALMTRPLGPNVALSVDAERDTVVVADPGQMEQIVLNLLINARDALADGGAISITACTEGPPSNDVVLTVADDGIGMAPEVQARVFEPFFTTKPRGEASGLGLATVQAIVEQAGGTVTISSRAGAGTTVTVRLPLAGPARASNPHRAAPGGPGAPRSPGRSAGQPA